MAINPAQPIKNKSEDKFERLSFAEHLADFLCLDKDAPSIVIGIEGKWGDGKTSCINLLKEVLNKKQKPIIVDYNPWLISTLDSVIEGFIVELASAIGLQSASKNGENAAKKVLQFGKILSPIKLIPGVEPWGSIVEGVLKTVGQSAKAASELANISIQYRKNDLQKHIKKINRPIVVIIDDIDRLPPEHVRIVFQMLKAICDFDGVSYLIAYDPEPVAKALSYNDIYNGKKYMEKLVQTSYQLPRLPYICMKDYVQDHVLSLAKKYELNITGDEEELLQVLLNKTDFVQLFETPRDVIRLCNRLHVSVPNIRNEVAFADIIAFEMLELKFPDISRIIRIQRNSFVSVIRMNDNEFAPEAGLFSYELAFTEATEEKKNINFLDELLRFAGNDEQIQKNIKTLLLFLFPKIGGKEYHIENMPRHINRIQNRDAFLKLLHCGIATFTFSAEEANRFCKKPEERYQILADHRNDLDIWINYLEQIALGIEIQDPIGLCNVFIDEVKGPDGKSREISMTHCIANFLYEIIKKHYNHATRLDMLKHLVDNTKSLSISEEFLLTFLNEAGIWKTGKYFPDEKTARTKQSPYASNVFSYSELYDATNSWLASVRKVANTEGILETQKDVISILYRWGQLNNNDFSEVCKYVFECSHNEEWLIKFIKLFDPETHMMDDLIRFISPDILITLIKKISSTASCDEHIKKIDRYLHEVLEGKEIHEKSGNSE